MYVRGDKLKEIFQRVIRRKLGNAKAAMLRIVLRCSVDISAISLYIKGH